MSIFDDKKLIEVLVKEGAKSIAKQAAPPRYTPPSVGDTSQGPPQLTPQQTAAYNLAKKMATDLLETVAPDDPDVVKKPSPLSSASGAPVEIKPENLRDLGDFIRWASGVLWKGKPIAWLDKAPAGEEDAWTFNVYSQDRNDRDPATRKVNQSVAYANKPALLEMLGYLRDSKEAKTEKPYQVQLSKIISQVNQFLEKNEQLGEKAADKDAAGTLDPNAIVDGFPSSTLDMNTKYEGADKQPNFEGMPVPLMVKHISSREGLIGWLNNMKVKTDKAEVPVFKPEVGDPCIAVHILYLRAKYLAGIAVDTPTKPYKKMADLYLANITNFGKTFENAKGPCAVVSQGNAAPGADKPGAGASAADIAQNINKIYSNLPLTQQDIDLKRIQDFFTNYSAIVNANYKENLGNVKNTNDNLINQVKSLTSTGTQNNFPLSNLVVDTVVGWARPPNQGPNAFQILGGLIQVIDYTKQALQMFYNDHGSKYPSNLQQLQGQFVIADTIIRTLRSTQQTLVARMKEGR
jgi:hypothetical protein